jgi:hypothetical protein
VDGAARQVPPRWVLLLGVERSERPTRVVERSSIKFSPNELEILRRGTVLVTNGRHSFLTTLLDSRLQFLRFDPSCMRPASRSGARAWTILLSKLDRCEVQDVLLEPGALLVLDNWSCLHGRGPGSGDCSRTLLRVAVEAGA